MHLRDPDETKKRYWELSNAFIISLRGDEKTIISEELKGLLDQYPKLLEEKDSRGETFLHRLILYPDTLIYLLNHYGKKINIDVRSQPKIAGGPEYAEGQGPTLLHDLASYQTHLLNDRKLFNLLVKRFGLDPTLNVIVTDFKDDTLNRKYKNKPLDMAAWESIHAAPVSTQHHAPLESNNIASRSTQQPNATLESAAPRNTQQRIAKFLRLDKWMKKITEFKLPKLNLKRKSPSNIKQEPVLPKGPVLPKTHDEEIDDFSVSDSENDRKTQYLDTVKLLRLSIRTHESKMGKLAEGRLEKLIAKDPKLLEMKVERGETLLHQIIASKPDVVKHLLTVYKTSCVHHNVEMNLDMRSQPMVIGETRYAEEEGPTLLHELTRQAIHYFHNADYFQELVDLGLNPDLTVTEIQGNTKKVLRIHDLEYRFVASQKQSDPLTVIREVANSPDLVTRKKENSILSKYECLVLLNAIESYNPQANSEDIRKEIDSLLTVFNKFRNNEGIKEKQDPTTLKLSEKIIDALNTLHEKIDNSPKFRK